MTGFVNITIKQSRYGIAVGRRHHPGIPGDTVGKESVCQCRRLKRSGSIPVSGRFPVVGVTTYSSILPGKIPWTEEPGGATVQGVPESQIQLSTH